MDKVANKLGQWHSQEVSTVDREPALWKTIHKWMQLIPEQYEDPEKDKKFKELIDMERIKSEVYIYVLSLSKIPHICLCNS